MDSQILLFYLCLGYFTIVGHNGYCQLGNGSTTHGLNPTLIQGSLSGKIVLSVACGRHHSLALTNEGEVIH